MITGVGREERIEHYVAVVARDVDGRPDRVEHAQIVPHDKIEGLARTEAFPTSPFAGN
jgi:predicted amidohydrolase YtcJ